MDKVYLTIIVLTIVLIVLNYIEKKKTRESFDNVAKDAGVVEIPKNSGSVINPETPQGALRDLSVINPETLLSTSAFFRDDGSHRGNLDNLNQLPAPYQHYGNRNQMYDFSVYGDQPFVQCSKCKQMSNCVQYPGTASDKFTNICTQCNRPPHLGLIREIGYFPPEVQARAIGFTRMCTPSM
jgi:hypothetical protein